MQLIDRIGHKLLEQPLTIEDLMALINKGSTMLTRGEMRVELNHLLASQMITSKVAHGHDLYSLTKLGRKWMESASEDAA